MAVWLRIASAVRPRPDAATPQAAQSTINATITIVAEADSLNILLRPPRFMP